MDSRAYQIPPFLRNETNAPIEHARWYLDATDRRIAWLAERCLRPHATILAARAHCAEFLEGKVPNLEIEKFLGSRTYGVAPQKLQPK